MGEVDRRPARRHGPAEQRQRATGCVLSSSSPAAGDGDGDQENGGTAHQRARPTAPSARRRSQSAGNGPPNQRMRGRGNAVATRRWAARRSSTSGWTSRPSPTMTLPLTTVCRAICGPQRSQARRGRRWRRRRGPVSGHTAMSATAPGAARRARPARGRLRRRGASSSAIRCSCGRRAQLARSIACAASSHRLASADDEPSTPSPTSTPAARRSTTGAMPDERMRLLDGQWATPTFAAPRLATSPGSGITQWGEPRPIGQPPAVRSR